MVIIKKTKVRNSGEDIGKEELLYTFGVNAIRHCGKQYGHLPKVENTIGI